MNGLKNILKNYLLSKWGFLWTRTDFTDVLHDNFGFRTDYQIVNDKMMKRILKDTKKQKTLRTF